MASPAQTLARRLDELGRVTDESGKLTRTFLSPAMKRANELVAGWMNGAGLATRVDSVGNLIGRLEGTEPRTKTLLLGSHLDTVRDAGKFDGALGVLLPIVALRELRRLKVRLPFPVEVIGFSEEEGVRFGRGYLGSAGYAGVLKSSTLKLRDADSVSVLEVLEEFNAGKFSLPKPAHRRSDLLGYVEVHIEQGPVLEQKELAVGVVTAIAGQSRMQLTWKGKAGHAGTTPMALRRDALAGAAEFLLVLEAVAKDHSGLLATVGTIATTSGAANVIPGEVVHSLDIRHACDPFRLEAINALRHMAAQIARKRKLTCSWTLTQDHDAVPCSAELTAVLAKSVRSVQGRCVSLVSGAGHDGVIMSKLVPVAMLFVRCRNGLSHHPDEYVSPADLDVALQVMLDFLQRMAELQA